MPRRYIGLLCLLLGGFLLTAAAVSKFWGEPNSQRVPLSTDSTTHLSGTADKLNPATGKVENFPVKIVSYTKVDPKASTGTVAVFTSQTCVVKDSDNPPPCTDGKDPRTVDVSVGVLAADRHTAKSVNDFKGKQKDYVPHDGGLVLKYPFNTEKKTYQVWSDTAGKSFPATFAGEATLDGLKVYKFDIKIDAAPITIAEGITGTLDYTSTQWVDPVTGSVIDQKQHDVRKLEDGSTALDLTAGYTPSTVKDNIATAKKNISSLHLVSNVIPIGGLIGGLLLLGVGTALNRGGNRREDAGAHV